MITIKNDSGELLTIDDMKTVGELQKSQLANLDNTNGIMTVGELRRQLANFPDDMQIVRPTNRGTLIPVLHTSEITTIRSRLHEKTDILPMVEYRVPWNPEDEPDETRRKFLLLK